MSGIYWNSIDQNGIDREKEIDLYQSFATKQDLIKMIHTAIGFLGIQRNMLIEEEAVFADLFFDSAVLF